MPQVYNSKFLLAIPLKINNKKFQKRLLRRLLSPNLLVILCGEIKIGWNQMAGMNMKLIEEPCNMSLHTNPGLSHCPKGSVNSAVR